MLKIDNVTVRFGGLTAVKEMKIEVEKNTIHSLIGPNGAGKTTLFNVITRVVEPAEGDVLLNGESLLKFAPEQIITKGITRTFQNLQLFQTMSLMDNLYAGYAYQYDKSFLSVLADKHKSFEADLIFNRIYEVAELLDFKERLTSFPAQLPYGVLKQVEIARALISDPDIILFDEPAAGLTNEETSEIIEIMKLLKERGKTVFLVEHDMNLVMNVSETISVMNFGEKIAEGTPEEVANNPEVIKVYLGSQD